MTAREALKYEPPKGQKFILTIGHNGDPDIIEWPEGDCPPAPSVPIPKGADPVQLERFLRRNRRKVKRLLFNGRTYELGSMVHQAVSTIHQADPEGGALILYLDEFRVSTEYDPLHPLRAFCMFLALHKNCKEYGQGYFALSYKAEHAEYVSWIPDSAIARFIESMKLMRRI